MKRFIFAIVLAIFCIFSLCIGARAEEAIPVEETVTEEEIQPPVDAPEETPPTETPEEPTLEEEVNVVTEQIVAWITENIEEIGVVITLVGYGIVLFNKLKTIIKSAGTINNNAITIAGDSKETMLKALNTMETSTGAITAHDAVILALMEKYQATAEDKSRLEAVLVEIKNYLKTSSKSNLEFSDELAELLALSNIPNYKKEEIGSRHVAAKKEIVEAEAKAEALLPTTTEEVKENVGEEA